MRHVDSVGLLSGLCSRVSVRLCWRYITGEGRRAVREAAVLGLHLPHSVYLSVSVSG